MGNLDLTALGSAAEEYGPFLFALLFVTSVTVIAQRAYADAKTPDQVVTFRRYFYMSFAVSLVLVTVSITYWVVNKEVPRQYVYTVDIRNVPAMLDIEPTPGGDAEACAIPWPAPVNGYPMQRVKAIFVMNQPLQRGSRLEVVGSPRAGAGGAQAALTQYKTVSLNVNSPETDLDFQTDRDLQQLQPLLLVSSSPQAPAR